jgi:hypothetical protein
MSERAFGRPVGGRPLGRTPTVTAGFALDLVESIAPPVC